MSVYTSIGSIIAEEMLKLGIALCSLTLVLLPVLTFGAVIVEISASDVDEDVGSIEACAVYSDLEEGTEVIFRTIGFADATPDEDFGSLRDTFTVTTAAGRFCANISIIDDNIIEAVFPEAFTVAAEIGGFLIDYPNVHIHDNDATFTFEQPSYTVAESDDNITVCVEYFIREGTSAVVTLETELRLFPEEGNAFRAALIAEERRDYSPVSVRVQASSPGGRRCITIPIIDDPESEGNEKFAVVVTVSGFLRTIEKLAIVSVEILDDDEGPLTIRFINNTPRVVGNTIEVEFTVNQPTQSVTCQLGRSERKECSSGTATFTDVQPGRYELRVTAVNSGEDRATVRRSVEVSNDPSFCTIHLINDGVTVLGDKAVIEFAAVGLADTFSCQLDMETSFPCSQPQVELNNLSNGVHRFRITPKNGCESTRRQRVKFVTPGV